MRDVSFAIRPAEIHALIGENGSGKSTLMKIIAGVYKPDQGEIYIDGQKKETWNPLVSQKQGISVIYQELCLFDDLSVAENVFLGHTGFTERGIIQWSAIYQKTKHLLESLGINEIDPRTKVGNLSIAQRQIIEIVKALAASETRILLMDEPTSALSPEESNHLFKIMKKLKADGVGIVFISHKLEEIFKVAGQVTVLRDGVYVGSAPIDRITNDQLVKMIIGKNILNTNRRQSHATSGKIMEVRNLGKRGCFKEISFDLHQGEILGIFGLVGAKRTEVAQALFGILDIEEGQITIAQKKVRINSPNQALNLGLGLIPEDRGTEGLVLEMSIAQNVTLPIIGKIFPFGFIRPKKEQQIAAAVCGRLSVKFGTLNHPVDSLSGGNKQKIVLAKWLLTNAKVLIFDEPTKGIDIGAKDLIHDLMNNLAQTGLGIIMISSELPEILKLSDRVIVMSKGVITGSFAINEANQDRIIRCASGIPDQPPSGN